MAEATQTYSATHSALHREYRRVCGEVDKFEVPGYADGEGGDDALRQLLEEARVIEARAWAKRARTTGDILFRAEIASRQNDIMAALEDPEADHDARACAELVKAVVDVLGTS